ncbi:MAG TPA: hypothetical protein VGV06_04075 [Methylomirabilota bacterium]|nr:hypothetical protein [Methylomirabilota bacterium]
MGFGTYYFLQAAPGMTHAEVIHRELDEMQWTEELGFDEVWLTERVGEIKAILRPGRGRRTPTAGWRAPREPRVAHR